jgi:hypothetical protein
MPPPHHHCERRTGNERESAKRGRALTGDHWNGGGLGGGAGYGNLHRGHGSCHLGGGGDDAGIGIRILDPWRLGLLSIRSSSPSQPSSHSTEIFPI